MLDKKSKIFLNYMDKQPNKQLLYPVGDLPDGITDREEMDRIVRGLKEIGYLESICTTSGRSIGVMLTQRACARKELGRKTRVLNIGKYIADKWISIIALIVSIISLYFSLCS